MVAWTHSFPQILQRKKISIFDIYIAKIKKGGRMLFHKFFNVKKVFCYLYCKN